MPNIWEWKPNAKQREFLALPDSITEALYGGAAGGGKTEVLLMLPITRGFYKHPKFHGLLLRRTYPELEKEVILRSHDFYAKVGGVYNQEKKRWTFYDNNKNPLGKMDFGHMQYEQNMREYDSAEYNYIGWDEVTSFTPDQYIYLRSRLRSKTSELPAIYRAATNPGNISHTYFKERFVDPNPKGGVIIVDSITKNKRIFIQAKLDDNEEHIDPNYARQLLELPEAERRAKRDGDWDSFEGQVFTEYRETHRENDPANAIHIVSDFTIPDFWPRILSIDWGFAADTFALWGAISPNHRLYIYREFAVNKTKISSWATEIGNLSRFENIESIVLCQSAWHDRGEAELIAEQFERFSGLRPSKAENSRILGKNNIQEYLRFLPRTSKLNFVNESYSDEKALSILRNKGPEAYQSYLDQYKPEEEETNLPKLQIFSSCSRVRDVIPRCIYADKDRLTDKPSEDVKEFKGDDPYDTLRYLVNLAESLRINSQDEENRRKKLTDINENLLKYGDQTRYYRQMQLLEARDKPKAKFTHRRSVYSRK